ncbi:MAG TPA: hypothetical protein VMV10_04790 [Pirellulales bacterium]|nr:hypothetical protein [Pirellulales bacterium]
MTSSHPSPQSVAESKGVPGEIVRTAISFLLFLHFFALAVAIFSNWSPSTLASRLRKVPGVRGYLQFFDMDQAYIGLYNLHDGMSEDTDSTVELDLKLASGEMRTFTLPEPGLRPHQRFRHFSRLAEVAADLASNQDLQSVVPQAIAKHYIARLEAAGQELGGGTVGEIRVGNWLLQSMEAMQSSRADERDPHSAVYYRKLYEARVLRVGGKVQLLKVEEARDVAPAASSAGAK